jgi:hypothetical protein
MAIVTENIHLGEISNHLENDDTYDYQDVSDGESEDEYDQDEYDENNEILDVTEFLADDS